MSQTELDGLGYATGLATGVLQPAGSNPAKV